MFELNNDNYYSLDADRQYMSCSQFQSFMACEAAAIAKLRGIFTPEHVSDALVQGNYFHTALESEEAHKAFCDDHFDEIYKTKETKSRGIEIIGKYAPYERLDEMLRVARTDSVINKFIEMSGENEKFMTGEIGGIEWRIRVDKYIPTSRRIIDYKTTADIYKLTYSSEAKEYQSFIEEYGYMMRAAVYGEIERQFTGNDKFPSFLIIAVSKQDPPDKGIFLLNDEARWTFEIENIMEKLPRIISLKKGAENPKRCGMCEYCRKTKIIKRIKLYTDLMPQFRNDPDNVEYDDYDGKDIFTV